MTVKISGLILMMTCMLTGACGNSTSTPSNTVRKYFECYSKKDVECLLKLHTTDYVKAMGFGSLEDGKVSFEFRVKYQHELISIDGETATTDTAQVKVTYKDLSRDDSRVEKVYFPLQKFDGQWLITNGPQSF